ncbi:MAG: hypothetical protein J6N72_08015, partial [Psychrobacter sp.]|nr:hypothetical protein [Psychrobacter sp.]
EELQLVATDCGLKVFIPKNTLNGYIKEDYEPHAQPFRVATIWTIGSIQHSIEDTVWAESVDMAAIDGVMSCLPVTTDGSNEDLFRKALEDSEDCSIEINAEHYALSKLEPLKHVTITLDNHKIDALVPKNHIFGQDAVLAKII